MQDLGFRVKKDLASTIRNYLKEKGRNVTEEDINEILQRIADINKSRPKGASIFLGGHKYFGGSNNDFIVKDGQQIDFSVSEYNKIFKGYLEKENDSAFQIEHATEQPEITQNNEPIPEQNEEKKLSDDVLKNIKNQAFKTSFANMSDKQLSQIANSDNLTTDTDLLAILAQELNTRNNTEDAQKITKLIQIIKGKESNSEEIASETTTATEILTAENADTAVSSKPEIQLPDIKINPSEDEIQNNINNLKPGESYTYLQVKDQKSWGYGQNQKNITWTRNNDNTLTKMMPDFQIDGSFGAITENYTADGKQLFAKRKLGGMHLTKGLYTTTLYSDTKPIKESTDLSEIYKITQENIPHTTRILGLMSPENRIYKNEKLKNNAISIDNQTFASKELKNLKGETVLTYKDGKFFNKTNIEIDNTQAEKIIEQLLLTQDLSELVHNYNS